MWSDNHHLKLLLVLSMLVLASVACLNSGGAGTANSAGDQTALVATYTALQAREQSELAQIPTPIPIEIVEVDVQPLVVEPVQEQCNMHTASTGGTLWITDFNSDECLTLFAISNSSVENDDYTADVLENGKYNFRVKRKYTSVYAVAEHIILEEAESDVELDVALDYLEGPNEVGFSLLCRVNPVGWYEFLITSGGRWQIMSTVDSGKNFNILAGGGIDFRHYGLESFKQGSYNFQASCVGDQLTLSVNDIAVVGASVRDFNQTHPAGSVGFALFALDSVWDYEENPVLVDFDSFEVRRP
ncbi:MAG: hypothetical protein DWQ07_14595 [Chloroflexi bacterium]|nr:MAG: hypothetical protein DWQ07_14595 [Chloroflexota bacterium]MBL1195688.1 hypothetical protein [Chloroflexota bacterium]NOH12976.1 hypothetical protein [Chloroflexota bacterium]